MKKEYKKYILLFVLFLIIMCLSPICGDDWGNYIEGSKGIKHMIGNAIGMYFSWEGRFISRLLINILTYNKWLWNIINSLVLVSTIYLVIKIINPKNKKICFLLSTLLILLMNLFTFSQVVVWLAGNITYLFVIPLLLYYFYCLFNEKENIWLIILNIIIPMFVEHMGLILIASNIFFITLNYFKTKKINKKLILYFILSLVSMLIMLLSPGSKGRSLIENTYFNSLSLIDKIIYNLPNFIFYTFFINTYLNIIMTISNIYLLKNIKNKLIRIISYLYMIPIPIFISFIYLISNFKQIDFINQNNTLLTLYFISYIIIDLILIIKEKDMKILFFYLIGIGSNTVMLLSPTWGFRTSLGTYIFLSIAHIQIIDKYIKENKIIITILQIIISLSMIFYLILYISIYRQYKDNLKRINEQIKNNSEIIEIVAYPGFVNCNINPGNEYHIRKFKEYYKIDENTEIKLIDNNWRYMIFYNKEQSA